MYIASRSFVNFDWGKLGKSMGKGVGIGLAGALVNVTIDNKTNQHEDALYKDSRNEITEAKGKDVIGIGIISQI